MNYQTGESGYYHNGMIWPFVQGYWAWAANGEFGSACLRTRIALGRPI